MNLNWRREGAPHRGRKRAGIGNFIELNGLNGKRRGSWRGFGLGIANAGQMDQYGHNEEGDEEDNGNGGGDDKGRKIRQVHVAGKKVFQKKIDEGRQSDRPNISGNGLCNGLNDGGFPAIGKIITPFGGTRSGLGMGENQKEKDSEEGWMGGPAPFGAAGFGPAAHEAKNAKKGRKEDGDEDDEERKERPRGILGLSKRKSGEDVKGDDIEIDDISHSLTWAINFEGKIF